MNIHCLLKRAHISGTLRHKLTVKGLALVKQMEKRPHVQLWQMKKNCTCITPLEMFAHFVQLFDLKLKWYPDRLFPKALKGRKDVGFYCPVNHSDSDSFFDSYIRAKCILLKTIKV